MTDKPTTQAGYRDEDLELVHSSCLYVATKLGDLLDNIIVVGGLVPSLLVAQNCLPQGFEAHAGTKDLDLGLALAILEKEQYSELGSRLRDAGFTPDANSEGNPTHQRWQVGFRHPITVDFLIPPSAESDQGGTLRHLQPDFAAVITPGLHLAFQDRHQVRISGLTPSSERAVRDIWVCGPGAFLVLKALAFRNRGENKDAYDLIYALGGIGVGATAQCLRRFLDDSHVVEALAIVHQDFTAHDSLGPKRVAEFLTGGADDDIQADTVGLALSLLREVG